MDIIDSVDVDHVDIDRRRVVLCSGSIASIPSDIDLQYLVIACTPGHYAPEQDAVVAELEALGVRVAASERNYLLRDFRQTLPCWVTRAFTLSGVNFRHLVVWEPPSLPKEVTRLSDVQYAALTLNRIGGIAGGGSAMFLLWPPVGLETAHDMFRMQFFSAVALAARSAWQTLYLMVSPDEVEQATAWFAELKSLYQDPPTHLPSLYGRPAFPAGPQRLSDIVTPVVENGRLTQRQHAAIFAYTTNSYIDTNRALRHADPQHPDFVAMQPLIEAIASGLSNLPNFTEGQVERGVVPFNGIEELYRDGHIALEHAFTSTSTRTLPFGNWKIRLHSALGKAVWEYSMNPNEREVLFDSAMMHLVTDVEFVDDERSIITSQQSIPADVGLHDAHL